MATNQVKKERAQRQAEFLQAQNLDRYHQQQEIEKRAAGRKQRAKERQLHDQKKEQEEEEEEKQNRSRKKKKKKTVISVEDRKDNDDEEEEKEKEAEMKRRRIEKEEEEEKKQKELATTEHDEKKARYQERKGQEERLARQRSKKRQRRQKDAESEDEKKRHEKEVEKLRQEEEKKKNERIQRQKKKEEEEEKNNLKKKKKRKKKEIAWRSKKYCACRLNRKKKKNKDQAEKKRKKRKKSKKKKKKRKKVKKKKKTRQRTSPVAPEASIEGRSRQRIKGYVVGSKLGTGSYGSVYEALDVARGRAVALKILPSSATRTRKRGGPTLAAVAEIAVYVTLLRHPNILPVYSVFHDEPGDPGGLVLVLERGICDLDHVLLQTQKRNIRLPDTGPLAARYHLRLRHRFARDLFCGVGYLHERGFIHCDIKPGNLILCGIANQPETWRLKLADYDLVQSVLQVGRNLTGSRLVTWLYRPPELALKKKKHKKTNGGGEGDFGVAVDWWSVGLVLVLIYFDVDIFALFGDDETKLPDRIRHYMGHSPETQKTGAEMAVLFLGTSEDKGVGAFQTRYGREEFDAIWRLIGACLQVDPTKRDVRPFADSLLFSKSGPDSKCAVTALADPTFVANEARFAATIVMRLLLPQLTSTTHLLASSLLFLMTQHPPVFTVDPMKILWKTPDQKEREEKEKTPPTKDEIQEAQEWVLACANLAAKHVNDIVPLDYTDDISAHLPWSRDIEAQQRVAHHEQLIFDTVQSAWLDYLAPAVPDPNRNF